MIGGYRLSPQAAAAQRRAEASRGGNVVPMPVRQRADAERRAVSVQDVFGDMIRVVGLESVPGAVVTIDSALTVPAVAAAVNVISSAIASLPLPVYRKSSSGSRERATGGIARMLHDAPNESLTSYEWRRALMTAKLTGGRGLSYIERAPNGRPLSLWLMDPAATTIRREGWRTVYDYREGGRVKTYQAADVIDLPFMLKPDGYSHRGPVALGKDAIGLAIAVTQYGARYFSGGGVPPFAIEGNFQTPQGMQRAADDLAAAVRKAASEERQALVMPAGHKITPIGGDPEKAQMVELQRFCVEQIARLYSIPPTFLQDLTHGTFSNTEQQDLHFVKHTLLAHAEQFEQEINLKLFGAGASTYAELNMDGLLRGDFATRMDGWAKAIGAGVVMPNEAREAENWPRADGGDQLFMQGATVPITQSGQAQPPANSEPVQ